MLRKYALLSELQKKNMYKSKELRIKYILTKRRRCLPLETEEISPKFS